MNRNEVIRAAKAISPGAKITLHKFNAGIRGIQFIIKDHGKIVGKAIDSGWEAALADMMDRVREATDNAESVHAMRQAEAEKLDGHAPDCRYLISSGEACDCEVAS